MKRVTSQVVNGRLAFADFVIDPAARLLSRASEPIHVQPKVMELLLCLLEHRDRFVPKEELQRALWADVVVGAASLPRLIKELRRVLDDPAAEPRLIRTLHGRGYQFIGLPLSVAAGAAQRTEAAAPTSSPLTSTLDDTRTGSETGLGGGLRQLQLRTLHPEGSAPLALSAAAPLRIGRSAQCDLVLPFEGVSRQHAELARAGPLCTLRDLDSRNGVFVNGEKLCAPTVLRCGQIVRIDGWIGMLEPALELGVLPRHPALQVGPKLSELLQPFLRHGASEALLVEGETGTGKSVIARAFHDWSRRRGRLFVIECSQALPHSNRLGWAEALAGAFESARGGTLLLEDVDALSRPQQDQLHGLWTEHAGLHMADDVRVLATARGTLRARVLAGEFRAQLHELLSARTLTLPPLRARTQDLPGLFRHALLTYNGGRAPCVSPRLVEALCLYDWPFNVRELQGITRGMLLAAAKDARLSRRHLPPRLTGQEPDSDGERLISALGDVLRDSEGDMERAAASASMSSPEAQQLLGGPRDSREGEWNRAF